jgi:hypothetical protein
MPASATTMMSVGCLGVLVAELSQYRHDRLRLGLVALEQVYGQRETGVVGEQPDGDLRVDPAFLAHADLAQPVLAGSLEVEGGQVVEHQREPAAVGCIRVAGPGDAVAVVPLHDSLQTAPEGGP